MEDIRIREKNITLINIKDIKTYIKRSQETIDRFQKQSKISTFEKTQITKLKEQIENHNINLKNMEQKILDIESGKYDDEIIKKMNEERLKISKSNNKIEKKTIEKTQKNLDNSKFIKKSFDITRRDNNEKSYDKEYKRYIDKCNSVPDYIIRNLKEMPSNKGYIWKGLWCFGELPSDNDKTLTMFEKINGDLKIHESDEDYCYVYMKKGKDKKVLISKTPRSDFIKNFRIWAKERGIY